MGLTAGLSVLSDRLFLMLFTVPMIVSLVLMFKKLGIKTTISLIVTIAVFSLLGLKIFNKIDSFPYHALNETKPADYEIISTQAESYFMHMYEYLLDFGFMALTLYLFILSLFLMAYVFIKSIKKEENKLLSFYAIFSLVFSVCVIAAPLISGKYQGRDCLRYSVYPIYLGVLNLAVFVKFLIGEKQTKRVLSFSLIGLNLVFLTIAVINFSPKGIGDFFNYYPEKARLLDDLAEKEDLKKGVANYWDAKVMTMFSKKGVVVRAVFDNLFMHQHVANDNWYFDNMFNFAVVSNFSDTSLYRSNAKDIQVITDQPKFKVVKTHTFTYLEFKGGSAIVTN